VRAKTSTEVQNKYQQLWRVCYRYYEPVIIMSLNMTCQSEEPVHVIRIQLFNQDKLNIKEVWTSGTIAANNFVSHWTHQHQYDLSVRNTFWILIDWNLLIRRCLLICLESEFTRNSIREFYNGPRRTTIFGRQC
jgi:hypothetical protein